MDMRVACHLECICVIGWFLSMVVEVTSVTPFLVASERLLMRIRGVFAMGPRRPFLGFSFEGSFLEVGLEF